MFRLFQIFRGAAKTPAQPRDPQIALDWAKRVLDWADCNDYRDAIFAPDLVAACLEDARVYCADFTHATGLYLPIGTIEAVAAIMRADCAAYLERQERLAAAHERGCAYDV